MRVAFRLCAEFAKSFVILSGAPAWFAGRAGAQSKGLLLGPPWLLTGATSRFLDSARACVVLPRNDEETSWGGVNLTHKASPAVMVALAIFVMMVINSLSAPASDKPAPDIIFLNGDIYTQATPARAQALAVRDGKVVAIGSNDDIRKLKGSKTEVIDLGGHFVMPGFNDAHCHLEDGGFSQMNWLTCAEPSRWQRCSSALRRERRPPRPANGYKATDGTTLSGRARSCRRGKTLMW